MADPSRINNQPLVIADQQCSSRQMLSRLQVETVDHSCLMNVSLELRHEVKLGRSKSTGRFQQDFVARLGPLKTTRAIAASNPILIEKQHSPFE